MTLDEAVKAFEADFEVIDAFGYEKEGKPTNFSLAPNGDSYVVLTSGGIRSEISASGAFFVDKSAAIEAWLAQAWKYADERRGKTLYWRERPVFVEREYVAVDQASAIAIPMYRPDMNLKLGTVYSRLVVSAEAPKL